MARAYSSLLSILSRYWQDYGGLSEWIKSPFVHVSLIVAVLNLLRVIDYPWRQLSLSALPTILGFSLAAYTITFTLMGSRLHTALSLAIYPGRNNSLLISVNATFFHVVFVQALALIFSIITNGTFFWVQLGSQLDINTLAGRALIVIIYFTQLLGSFLVNYAIILLFSIAIAMFRLGRLSQSAAIPLRTESTGDGNERPENTDQNQTTQ